jgi:hypothetical protein
MSLVFQLAPQIREYLNRTIRREQDLVIPTDGRLTQDDRTILPDDLGATPCDPDQRWTVSALMQEGRRAATDSETSDPTTEQCILAGLMQAARLSPFDVDQLSDAETSRLVRLSLFDLGTASEQITDNLHARVNERFLELFERHLGDGTEQFNRWFIRGYDNIVHAISKRRRGGIIARQAVRQTLLELIFQSYSHVAECVHVFRRAFGDALSNPLSEEEQRMFDVMYAQQSWLGNLTLIQLQDLDVMRLVTTRIQADPDNRELQGALLRMMFLNAEMLRNKRRSESRYKRQRPQCV